MSLSRKNGIRPTTPEWLQLPYLPPPHILSEWLSAREGHWTSLMRASVTSLLIGLSYRPERFLGLSGNTRREVVRLLQAFLPGELGRYLSLLRETGEPYQLVALLDHSYLLPEAAASQQVIELCHLMQQDLLSLSSPVKATSAEECFAQLRHLLLGPLGFGSVFVLVDGADAYVSEQGGWQVRDWLAWLLRESRQWAAQRVFFKGFFPIEIFGPEDFAGLGLSLAQLQWSPPLLAEVIRRRVWAASRGAFGSLDAVSSQDLRDVETQLVKHVEPLPREAIVLVRRLLQEYAGRVGSQPGYLINADIERAVEWYRRDRLTPNSQTTAIGTALAGKSASFFGASGLPADA